MGKLNFVFFATFLSLGGVSAMQMAQLIGANLAFEIDISLVGVIAYVGVLPLLYSGINNEANSLVLWADAVFVTIYTVCLITVCSQVFAGFGCCVGNPIGDWIHCIMALVVGSYAVAVVSGFKQTGEVA